MRLSIITVCLNNRSNLEKTIRSVLEQTWNDFEFIVVDGKSTDGTADLLSRYAKRINKQISEPDTGIYNAQNKGIKLSKGEFLLFLNAGDTFAESRSLEKFFDRLNGDYDLIYGDIFLEKDGHILSQHTYPDSLSLDYWRSNFLCHQAVLHRRTLFEKHGLYNEELRYASDHEFFFKVWLDKDSRIRHVQSPLVIYNLNGVTGNLSARQKILREYRPILKKYLGINFRDESKIAHRFFRTLVNMLLAPFTSSITNTKIAHENTPRKTKVLLLNASDSYGGAARAAQRILTSLANGNFEIYLGVKKKSQLSKEILEVPLKSKLSLFGPILRLLRLRYFILPSFKTTNSILHSPSYVSKMDTLALIREIDPDIVHLNWVGSNLMTIEEIGRIKKPIVWTMHDMWPFCGAEHVTKDERFVQGYSTKNRPKYESGFDLNGWTWRRKKRAFQNIKNLQVVCPSAWLADCARRSVLFKDRKVSVVPNGLDTETFKPSEKVIAKQKLHVGSEKILVLFGALDSTTEFNKGYHLLLETLNFLRNTKIAKQMQLAVFGNTNSMPETLNGFPVEGFGPIWDDHRLATLYSAADVTVVPSLIESFGQTASESLACGTPVACFDTTGLKSVVDHMENGYRAECYSPAGLAAGIDWIVSDRERYNRLSAAAREKAVNAFSLKILANNYSEIYSNALKSTL